MIKKIFEQNKFFELSMVTVCVIFFIYYYTQTNNTDLFEFLKIIEVEGSFIDFFMANIYWFVFFWIGTTIPLNYFFNELVNIPILAEIRKRNKLKYALKCFASVLIYCVCFVSIFSFIEIYLNPRQFMPIIILSLILIESTYLILIMGLLMDLLFNHFSGIFIQSMFILLCMFNSKFLILPKQVIDTNQNIFNAMCGLLFIFIVQIIIIKLFIKKEIV